MAFLLFISNVSVHFNRKIKIYILYVCLQTEVEFTDVEPGKYTLYVSTMFDVQLVKGRYELFRTYKNTTNHTASFLSFDCPIETPSFVTLNPYWTPTSRQSLMLRNPYQVHIVDSGFHLFSISNPYLSVI